MNFQPPCTPQSQIVSPRLGANVAVNTIPKTATYPSKTVFNHPIAHERPTGIGSPDKGIYNRAVLRHKGAQNDNLSLLPRDQNYRSSLQRALRVIEVQPQRSLCPMAHFPRSLRQFQNYLLPDSTPSLSSSLLWTVSRV
jgi:hypothetical protein